MSKPLIGAIFGLAGLVAAGAAAAADREFCRDYAQAAVRQVRAAQEHSACAAQMADAARWSPEFRDHIRWCLHVSKDTATDERHARHRVLQACAR